MNVLQQDPSKQNPMSDLLKSVDRNFMVDAFKQEFLGVSCLDEEINCHSSILKRHENGWSCDKSTRYDEYNSRNVFNFWDKQQSLSGEYLQEYENFECEGDLNDSLPETDYKDVRQKFAKPNYVGGATFRVLRHPIKFV